MKTDEEKAKIRAKAARIKPKILNRKFKKFEPQVFFLSSELAEILGVKTKSLPRVIKYLKLIPVKEGKNLHFYLSDIYDTNPKLYESIILKLQIMKEYNHLFTDETVSPEFKQAIAEAIAAEYGAEFLEECMDAIRFRDELIHNK